MDRRSVAGVALRGKAVLVARRKAGGSMGGTWEFPGGKAEPGEDDARALVREWLEEFDVPVRPIRLLGESSFSNRGKDYRLAAWLIEAPDGGYKLLEHDELRWVGAAELGGLALSDSDRSLLPLILPFLS